MNVCTCVPTYTHAAKKSFIKQLVVAQREEDEVTIKYARKALGEDEEEECNRSLLQLRNVYGSYLKLS